MALKNKAAPVAQAGAFEQGDAGDTAVAQAPATAQSNAADVANTAIAKASTTSAVAVGKLQTILADIENALPAVEFGVLPRLVGSNGQVMDGDKKLFGDSIKLTLVSWNKNFVISPGDDSDEAKALVRYSRDGVTIDDTGESVVEYLKNLREVEQYPDANVKEYCELVGILNEAAKPCEHVGGMVQISLSPQSRKSFEGYRLQQSVKVRLGQAAPEGQENIVIRAEVKSMGNNTFTLLKVSDK